MKKIKATTESMTEEDAEGNIRRILFEITVTKEGSVCRGPVCRIDKTLTTTQLMALETMLQIAKEEVHDLIYGAFQDE